MKMIRTISFCLFGLLNHYVMADDFLNVKVVSVYDGDTIKVEIPGVPSVFGDKLGIRIKGIDTPEKRTKNTCEKDMATVAKKTVQNTLSKAKTVNLKNCTRGKYFRLVCDVYADALSISHLMVNEGLAYQYDGGTKKKINWCKGRIPASERGK